MIALIFSYFISLIEHYKVYVKLLYSACYTLIDAIFKPYIILYKIALSPGDYRFFRDSLTEQLLPISIISTVATATKKPE